MSQSETPKDRSYLKDIYFISTLLYISANLIFRITETTLQSLAMLLFNIPHSYRLTLIHHKTRSLEFWDVDSVVVVYGVCALLLLLGGVFQFRRLVEKSTLIGLKDCCCSGFRSISLTRWPEV